MPLFKNEVANAVAFTGLANAGLFSVEQTGARSIQPRLNSVNFHTEGAAIAWVLYKQDPNDATNKIVILAGTSTDMAIEGGALILPVEEDGEAWPLLFESAVMNGGVGFFSVDFDYANTEG